MSKIADDLKQRLRSNFPTTQAQFEAANRIEQLEAERDELRFALENVRLFAARNRKEDWGLLILGFCAEGGVVGSVTR